ncbi:MAG TPA: hypothetical protein VM345_11720 [Acidimicrobiales bacterium]|nr:hypothetical protein [Acidimicrobiales bacterium]
MAAELEPPALAALVDAAERPRTDDWSFRAAVTRYAQPEPQRASEVIELLRRIEAWLRPHHKHLEAHGHDVWAAVERSDPAAAGDAHDVVTSSIVDVMRALRDLDALGDVLAAWAAAPSSERPDAAVDEAVADVRRRIDAAGVPYEERPPGPRNRG